MININELRSMVNASQFESFANSAISSLLDCLEEAEKNVALLERLIDVRGSELNAVAKERDALRNEIAYVKEVEFPRKAQAVADAWKGKCKRLEVERDALRAKVEAMMWQPIETAPKDNKRPLWLARFNDDGTIQSFDYNGSWERESESWEMPGVYYFWASENGNVEEPTHWMYQPDGFSILPGALEESK